MKGVFLTPDISPFFPSDTDIQTKINVIRHRHSELLARQATLRSARHTTLSLPSRRRTLWKILSRHPTLRPPFIGPGYVRYTVTESVTTLSSWQDWGVKSMGHNYFPCIPPLRPPHPNTERNTGGSQFVTYLAWNTLTGEERAPSGDQRQQNLQIFVHFRRCSS